MPVGLSAPYYTQTNPLDKSFSYNFYSYYEVFSKIPPKSPRPRDKSEVGEQFASDSEAELEAPIGAPAFSRRWSGEAAEPLLAEKIKLSPVRRSVSDAA